jgi:hypothetical protein
MISVASSIRFKKQDGLMASFDNTLFEDETPFRVAKHRYYHKLYATDTVTIQAEVDTGENLSLQQSIGTMKQGMVVWGEYTNMAGESKVFEGTYYDYWELDVAMSTYTTGYVRFRAVILLNEAIQETWYSEPVEIIAANAQYLQIEFFNLENAWHVYYDNVTEANRISHLLRVRGEIRVYKPGGEQSVFDNQDEIVKTSGEVKRVLTLKTEAIPPYLAEMLAVALAHDKFFVNEVEFVAEGNPEYENSGDLATFTCQLTQRDIPGFNAHDTGYNCDTITTNDGMTILQELAASGQKSLTPAADHMVLSITGEQVTGIPTIKAGTTPGGNDILFDMSLDATTNPIEVALIPTDKASLPAGIIYVTVSGVGATANIYVATFKNRQ